MLMSKFITRIKNVLRRILKPFIVTSLDIDKCVIICNNCIGGLLYNDYGLRFESPTINLQFPVNDFLKFASNIDHYMHHEIKEINVSKEFYKRFNREESPFPVGQIDDIKVYFQHYATFEDAVKAWRRRVDRYYECLEKGLCVNLILVTKNCDNELLQTFEKLPYEHKIMLTESSVEGDNVFVFDMKKGGEDWFSFQKGLSLKKKYEQFEFSKWLM